MEKRMIIAIVLSMAVLFGFQTLNKPVKSKQVVVGNATTANTEAIGPSQGKALGGITPLTEEQQKLIKEELTEINTDKYKLIFSNAGGTLKEIYLKEFSNDKQEGLIIAKGLPQNKRIFATKMETGGISDTAEYALSKTEDSIEYKTKAGSVEITKTYKLGKSLYNIDLDVTIRNIGSVPTSVGYSMVGPAGLDNSNNVGGQGYIQADALIGDAVVKIKPPKETQTKTGDIKWVGLKNTYFALIIKPLQPVSAVTIVPMNGKNIITEIKGAESILNPGQSLENKYIFYAGPLQADKIAAVGYEMEKIVDYGFFGGVSKVLVGILRYAHSVTKNWGVAIILLTLLVNLILFPLTMKSFASMHQMKKVQPHMQKLKELHKDNPQKLNKEMMELYKKYNVNPLGGCLPMLLQMPIFIALYQGLIKSIELKGANFLWIKDLSTPDAVPIPVTLPLIGNHLNILPLLMIGAMFAQQKMSQAFTGGSGTSTEQEAQQKMMLVMMPLLFGFLFYNMPSGLVLYWLTNTILMTGEQALISKRMEK